MNDDVIEIFTDGGCWDNPGPGGWAALLRYQKREKKIYGTEPYTSNNRMEMMAAIEALKALKKKSDVIITTDSTYLKNGITSWIQNWKRNGWKTKDKKLVKNIDLWQALDILIYKHTVEWRWVRGHTGHRENELVDKIVKNEIHKMVKSFKKDSQESFGYDLF